MWNREKEKNNLFAEWWDRIVESNKNKITKLIILMKNVIEMIIAIT